MTQDELEDIFKAHKRWLRRLGGSRAQLAGADLTDRVFCDCDLRDADFRGATLTGANFEGASLRNADFRGAVLIGANFDNADLTGGDLTDADLRDVNIPVIPHIDAAILAAVDKDPSKLDMADWHSDCGTTHCRAGWAITLAGERGAELERDLGSGAAGALIYAVSRPGVPIPNFYASRHDALYDIRECAAADPLPATEA